MSTPSVAINSTARAPMVNTLRYSSRLRSPGTLSCAFSGGSAPLVGQQIVAYDGGTSQWGGHIERVAVSLLDRFDVGTLEYRVDAVSWERRLDYIRLIPPSGTSDPSCTFVAASGVVDISGTTVTRVSGDKFDKNLKGMVFTLNGSSKTIATVTSTEVLTITASGGTVANAAWSVTMTAGNIVRSLVAIYCSNEAMTAGTIEDGPDVGKQVYEMWQVSAALNDLAEKASFIWYVKPDSTLMFHVEGSELAPDDLIVSGGGGVEGKQGWTFEKSKEDMCNVQLIRVSFNATAPQYAEIEGDGTSAARFLTYPVALIQGGTIEDSGETRDITWGVRGVDTGKDIYYGYGEYKLTKDTETTKTVTDVTNTTPIVVEFASAHGQATGAWVVLSGVDSALNHGWRIEEVDSEPTKVTLVGSEAAGAFSSGSGVFNPDLDSGDFLRLFYRRLGGDIVQESDSASITARGAIESTSGRYERFEEQTQNDQSAVASAYASAVVAANKDEIVRTTVEIEDEDGYYPGQRCTVTNSLYSLSSEDMLIEGVSGTEIDGKRWRYSIDLIQRVTATRGVRELYQMLRNGTGSAGGTNTVTISGGSTVGTPGGTVVGSETFVDVTYAATITIDCASGQCQRVVMTGSPTFAAPSNASGKRLRLVLVQDGTGGRVPTFNSAWKVPAAFEIDTTADTQTVIDYHFDNSGNAIPVFPVTGLPT
jgi:hypothetical protein